ncbi:hypothetical protein D187_004488 [Cystobacter fuscus DSM 2262]|uniref:Uncharacterized protein n=1 Tax=Cystobacter fuscus (strain ATCC 25194 / DSM 2262 / NBRC 100088 / M29) TaxID=1242864 RepID=S9Q9D0_CYSF2|nr:hypothetical protein [Cystobacter fuscus]EPX57954.1 hypothetical protein D187_004488 [Cystobacter fuscus DSM 2262]
MLEVKTDSEQQMADLSVGGGCPSCGGALSVRKTPGQVWGYCPSCRRLSQPRMAVGPRGIVLMHRTAAA